MSFILDALKKIEEDRRRTEDGRARERLAVGRARSAIAGPWLAMSAIAIVSAVATASVLYVLRGWEKPSSRVAASTPASVSPAPSADASSDELPSVLRWEEGVRPAAAEPVSESEPAAESEAEPESNLRPMAEAESERLEAEPEPESESMDAAEEGLGETSIPPPIRLVGRGSERAVLEPAGLVSGEGTVTAEAEAPPSDPAPELVLQGTSVIDGRPVAVVNDQRVFEGDWVDGARVIRIEERVIEVEFEGRRFRIRL